MLTRLRAEEDISIRFMIQVDTTVLQDPGLRYVGFRRGLQPVFIAWRASIRET